MRAENLSAGGSNSPEGRFSRAAGSGRIPAWPARETEKWSPEVVRPQQSIGRHVVIYLRSRRRPPFQNSFVSCSCQSNPNSAAKCRWLENSGAYPSGFIGRSR